MPASGGLLEPATGRLTPAATHALLAIVAAALAIRVAVALFLPSIVQQDETFQYLEEAHRLVFGTGLVPWEYVVGARSWVFPGLIAGVIEISHLFGGSPEAASTAVAVFMAILSLTPVITAFLWGWRTGGLTAAASAGALNAVWFELVYFAPHPIAENIAADTLAAGLYVLYPGEPAGAPRRLAVGGFLLGLTLIFRLQLAPAVTVAAAWVCRAEIRARYAPFILGAALPILLSGLLDGFTWDWPFQSMALNVWINLKDGVAEQFSKAPVYQYLSLAVTYWSGALVLIILLALVGARRLPMLAFIAVTIFAVHTVLTHKEYRFNYPALPLLMTLVGIGSADVAARLLGGPPGRPARLALLWGIPAFWIVTSAVLARSREFYPLWYRDRGSIAAMQIINADRAACGVGIYPADMWDRSGGYAHLRAGLVLYGSSDGDPAAKVEAFNYLITYAPSDFAALGFTRLRCWAEPPGRTIVLDPICLWHRPRACEPIAAPPLRATPPVFLARSHPDWFAKLPN